MNKILIRAINRTIQAAASSLEDYQFEYRHAENNLIDVIDSLAKAAKLLRDASRRLNAILDEND